MLRRIVIATGLVALCAARAHAQIYTWRDANGNLVLSNRQVAGTPTVKTFAVPDAPDVRATRYVPADRTESYDDLIVEHSRQNGVREALVRAVVQVESAFNPYARSPKGAMGLMQLMPAVAHEFGVRNPFNPAENVRAGVAYLRRLLDRYDNNEQLALAAYNAGPGAVDKHGQAVPPYRETKNYVLKVNKIAGARKVVGTHIYKVVETVDGREVIKYTDQKPER
jgi:soluble lytic murein transglycosylase-like protein